MVYNYEWKNVHQAKPDHRVHNLDFPAPMLRRKVILLLVLCLIFIPAHAGTFFTWNCAYDFMTNISCWIPEALPQNGDTLFVGQQLILMIQAVTLELDLVIVNESAAVLIIDSIVNITTLSTVTSSQFLLSNSTVLSDSPSVH